MLGELCTEDESKVQQLLSGRLWILIGDLQIHPYITQQLELD
jgi:hypothetical protein